MAFQTAYSAQQPVTDFGLPPSSTKYSASLAADTDTALVIPGYAPRYKAVIVVPYDAEVYLAINKDSGVPAEEPAGASFLATNSELVQPHGMCRYVVEGEILHFITPDADTPISVILYSFDV